jgi:anti-sigma B factor antagonist
VLQRDVTLRPESVTNVIEAGRKVNTFVDLDVLQDGSTCTIRLKGRLTLGEAVDQFDAAVNAALQGEHNKLVLSLEAMNYLDSSGVGAIVNALTQSRKFGGDVKLVNPSPFATKVLKMVHILNLFEVYDTEAAALASYGK